MLCQTLVGIFSPFLGSVLDVMKYSITSPRRNESSQIKSPCSCKVKTTDIQVHSYLLYKLSFGSTSAQGPHSVSGNSGVPSVVAGKVSFILCF